MYMHWAARQGYGVRVLDEETEGQGCRSSTLEIEGKYAYDFLRNESGLHRFTRVSPYGGGAKIHTSFIGIKVTPVDGNQDAGVNSEKEIKIDMKDVKIETMRARGPGGQHVNKTESAVRIMHFPTKIIVSVSIYK